MKSKIKRKSKIVKVLSIIILLMTLIVGKTYAEELNGDVRVEEDSTLTYYLKVKNDGIDKEGNISSDSSIAKIKSDVIHVEDKLPDGLTFIKFEETSNGTIGAVQRGDSTTACSGRVIDDTNEESETEGSWNEDMTEFTYHGLHYNKNTNTVSFDVERLQAGCVLNVGIVTQTPSLGENEKRRDFYNFATITEDYLSDKSNTVHAFIGIDDKIHKVKYIYDGSEPENAPEPPAEMQYSEGSIVGLSGGINVEGYKFLGWKPQDTGLQVENEQFKMPNKDVVLVGSFKPIKIEKYEVKYKISGVAPDRYITPFDKEYSEGKLVTLDSLQPGDIIDGYRFLGWKVSEEILSDEETNESVFQMPNHNVVIVGEFERISYKVRYEFIGSVIPDEGDDLLPEEQSYYPGDKVVLEKPGKAEGFRFLGWYKKDNFKMPENDVVIQGEWQEVEGLFELKIKKEIINKKEKYEIGDTVKFKITVTNPEDFEIKNVLVRENNEKAKFIDGDGYEVTSKHIVTIDKIAAKETITIKAEYKVTDESRSLETNEVEIVGALTDNGYLLDLDKDYKATVQFKTAVGETDGVDTSDNIVKYIVMAIISLSTIIGMTVATKKLNKIS